MELTKEQKDEIESQIVETVLDALDKNLISTNELPQIADYALEGMRKVVNQNDLLNFLSQLSSRWSIFQGINLLEKSKMGKKIDTEVAEGVLTLAKAGKIEDALNLAKSQTQT